VSALPPTDARRDQGENVFVNLACNIVLPGLVLSKLSAPDRLGPVGALLLGISLPLGYGAWDFVSRRKWNFFSVVGLLSVGLTGTFALLKVDGFWFAVKEASVPTLFGVAVLATLKTGSPLVRTLVLNEAVVDVARIDAALAEHGARDEFDRLLRRATGWMAGTFAFSAVLNFVLARVLLVSPAGTPEFTAELGRMTWLSWPVIALPSMAATMAIFWQLMSGIRRLTGLDLEALLHGDRGAPESK
jgi:hypothetical protein